MIWLEVGEIQVFLMNHRGDIHCIPMKSGTTVTRIVIPLLHWHAVRAIAPCRYTAIISSQHDPDDLVWKGVTEERMKADFQDFHEERRCPPIETLRPLFMPWRKIFHVHRIKRAGKTRHAPANPRCSTSKCHWVLRRNFDFLAKKQALMRCESCLVPDQNAASTER